MEPHRVGRRQTKARRLAASQKVCRTHAAAQVCPQTHDPTDCALIHVTSQCCFESPMTRTCDKSVCHDDGILPSSHVGSKFYWPSTSHLGRYL